MSKNLKAIVAVTLVAASGTLATSQSAMSASYLVVSGDSTMFSNTSAGNDNDVFWSNLLGGGSNVLYQDGSSGFFNGEVPLQFTNVGGTVTQLGAGATLTAGSFLGQDLFVTAMPSNAFTGAEAASVLTFLNDGGNVLLAGEFEPVSATENGFINNLLGALGSTMSIVPGTSVDDPGNELANVLGGSTLTSGVTTFSYGFSAEVSGGTGLFTSEDTATTILASETFGDTAVVPVPASLPLLLAGLGSVLMIGRRRKSSSLA